MTKHLIISVFIILPAFVFSQKPSDASIKVFVPGDTAHAAEAAKKPYLEDHHVIKWNYSLLVRGVFLLNYEYNFDKKFTIEVGAGMTRRDIIFELSKGESYYTLEPTPGVGYAGEGGVRFYPKGHNNFDGFFISPIISYRKYVFTYDGTSSSGSKIVAQGFSPGYNFLDLQLKFGVQTEGYILDEALIEFYFGFAYRSATLNYLYEDKSPTTGAYQYIPVTKKIQLPQALIGLKIGLPF